MGSVGRLGTLDMVPESVGLHQHKTIDMRADNTIPDSSAA